MAKGGNETSGCAALGCLSILVLAAITMCSGGKGSSETAAKKAADKEAGFHCLSGWDGSHREFVAAVKAKLRDPGSFEHDETRVAPVSNGKHAITMKFGSRNGFGGMNRSIAVGDYDHKTCAPSDPVIVGQ